MVDSILMGVVQVLKEYGYVGVFIECIVECVGVSIGLLYQYFFGKDDVLEVLFVCELDCFVDNMSGFEFNLICLLMENLGNFIVIGVFNFNFDLLFFYELVKIFVFD